MPDWFYHFAFDAGSVEELQEAFEADRQGCQGHADRRSRSDLVDDPRIPTACYSSTPRGLRTRRPRGERGPTHYGYLASTLPITDFRDS